MAQIGGGHPTPHFEWYEKPEVDRPIMIAAFAGWNDAGTAASAATEYLDQHFSAEPFATIDAEDFFDFTEVRPNVELTPGGGRRIQWPTTSLSVARGALGGRDLVTVRGVEPQLRWRTFCEAILAVAADLDASLLVTFGALLADVPHTRPTVVYGTSGGGAPELDNLERSSYEGPTGIVGVLHSASAVAGLPYASLWAAVPTYVPGAVSPKAALALLKRLRDLLGVEFSVEDLEGESREYVRQVASYVDEDPETLEFIAELERHYDANQDVSPETLVAEVEQFLRQRGDR